MAEDFRKLDEIRDVRSELENHYIDELVAGRLSRRQFMRKGAVIGMSTGLMGAVLAACGSANKTGSSATASSSSTAASTSTTAATKGGTLRLASEVPAAAVNPLTVSDAGGLCMLAQTGEFLTYDNNVALAAAADAGHQLEAERRRQDVDVQDPPGRQVPRRRAR